MAFTLLTQNQAQITAQNDANIYRMLSMGEDLTFIEDIKLEFSASQVGIKEGYYLVCGRLVKAENTIISIPSTKGVYQLCLRVQPSASAIADRVKLILLDSTQSRSTTDVNGDTASGIYDALLADFDTVTMRFTQRIQYAGVPLIDRVPTATKNSKGTVIAGQNLSINNQGVLNVVIPKAKASALGGVKVGSGLSVEDDGTLSANVQEIPKATSSALGGVKIGNGLSVTSDGVLSADVQEIPVASVTTLGGVKVGSGLNIDSNGVLSNANLIEIPQKHFTVFEYMENCRTLTDSETEIIYEDVDAYICTKLTSDIEGYAVGVAINSDFYANSIEIVALKVNTNGEITDKVFLSGMTLIPRNPTLDEKEMGYTAASSKYYYLTSSSYQSMLASGFTHIGFKHFSIEGVEKDLFIAFDVNYTVFKKMLPMSIKVGNKYYAFGDYAFQGMLNQWTYKSDTLNILNSLSKDADGNLYFNGKKVVLEN